MNMLSVPPKLQDDENQEVVKAIKNSLIDDRLIDRTAEIMKGQESARNKQQKGKWPEKFFKS